MIYYIPFSHALSVLQIVLGQRVNEWMRVGEGSAIEVISILDFNLICIIASKNIRPMQDQSTFFRGINIAQVSKYERHGKSCQVQVSL